ncbi:MAG: hypothetical protein LBP32_09240 [Spirochaetaceae bacterium]|jgi:hypothetical protein|nr:hypothetical protein [Spirochaetaceae bacterium]
MDKEQLIALLRERGAPADPRRREAINRLEAALSVPGSFDELEWELPPAARYVGPGVWMDAIRNGVT